MIYINLLFLHQVTKLFRMTVGLNWTRARAFNPRFEQNWVHFFCSRELNELGSCSKELIEFEFLFDELYRTRIFVRSNIQFETVVWVEIRIECSTHELSDRLRCRVESEHANSFELELWISSRALILELSYEILFVESTRIESKCSNSTRRLH